MEHGILAHSDINVVSAKHIRKELQDIVGEDLSSQKNAIKELIMQRFDLFVDSHEEEADKTETPVQNSDADGEPDVDILSPAQKREATYDDDDDDGAVAAGEHEPPSKKRRQSSMESDAALAARLQAEENLTRRRTRGAGSKKPTPKKKTKKVKSAAKMKTADGAEGDDAPKKNTGFHRPMGLSPALSAFLDGAETMPRPQIVKHLWQYIRANDLQDPADRRQIRCDDKIESRL
ncbi:SWIB/MDM2 domain-containing protein [Ascosphaera apis ARSEF 7405]|uniref:SWIB/MDM2 domain-containing protein n=1 Tax=Ascosphaera apis ARSEF 7405 TaxID=392613 RepID=A0A167ZTY1_9EURO|nr:SWIB/MDM2 domain-containing protein [Ascosphaera apis ARSEF 7405]